MAKEEKPEGLGGWLILVHLGIYLIGIFSIVLIYAGIIVAKLYPSVSTIYFFPGIIFLLASIISLNYFYKRKKKFISFMKAIVTLYFLYLLAQIILIFSLTSLVGSPLLWWYVLKDNIARSSITSLIVKYVPSILSVLLWIYLKKSERVKNTFVN